MRTRFLASLGTLFTSTALAFSQVPSGYYPSYPASPVYGSYPVSTGVPGYGYGNPTMFPYAVTYDSGTTAKAVPVAAEPTKTPSQPMPADKGSAESLAMPKESGQPAAAPSQNGAVVVPGPDYPPHGEPADQGGGWLDRVTSFDLHPRAWFSADYMRWWERRQPLPLPLVTAGDPTMTAMPGALGQPGTQIFFGGGLSERSYNGYQAEAGIWLDEGRCWGVEAGGFVLPKNSSTFGIGTGPGLPTLFIPVFMTNLNQESAVPLTGVLTIPTYQQLWGLEFNGVAGNVCKGEAGRIDVLLGVRYVDLREQLELDVQNLATQLFDRFSTSNRFYGGQVGAHGSVEWSIFSLDLTAKIAIGGTHESSVVNGATTTTVVVGGVPMAGTFPGGIFTTPSNIGKQATDVISVVPQVEARVGIRVCEMVRLFAAYDFLGMSDVVRPGNQISRNVNFTELLGGPVVGPPGAGPQLNTSFFWAQGVTVGMEISF